MATRSADCASRSRRSQESTAPALAPASARADGDQSAVHAYGVCSVEHPPSDPACRCPGCICEECRPNECPCAGAGERARDDHDRGLFTDRFALLGGWRLPTGSV